jgi:glutamate-1-semialdehyde 2,1-aminomutase
MNRRVSTILENSQRKETDMENQKFLEEFWSKIQETYAKRRPKSQKLYREAQSVLPGGDTRSVTFFRPFPTFMDHGEACRLYDVDGNAYIDFGNNQTSLVHGHAHPKIVEAVIGQVKKGSVFATPVKDQFKLAQIICDRLPSADKVRFCNSGTEATMGAIRLARAYRKKYKIVKVEGGYHGSHDAVEISVKPPIEKAGHAENPNSVPEDISVPPGVINDCVVIPFNNSGATTRIIEEHQADLAAVIVEPVQGSCGMVPSDPDYLKALREVTSRYRIPLIFDEVYTFRLAKGGWQELHHVVPDITALGKIIGGGYPVGAIAGREEFMDLFSPLKPDFLTHSGTFNGNPVTMVAGVAALTALTGSAIDRINKLGKKLRANFISVLQEAGVIAQVSGTGSLAQVHFTKEEVRDWRSASTARVDIRSMLNLLLMDKGIFPAGRLMFNISTPMGEKEVEEAGTALKNCLIKLKPYIEKAAPELIL